jgi:hypothetical protein
MRRLLFVTVAGCRGGFDTAGALNTASKDTVGKARNQRVAGRDLGGGADDVAVLVEDQGIAAVKDGERRKRVQLGVERGKCFVLSMKQALNISAQMVQPSLEAVAGLGKCLSWVVT